MPKFAYRVEDSSGKQLEGVLEALSEDQAQQFLTERKYGILSLKKQKRQWTLEGYFKKFESANPVHFNFFIRQLATLLKAGVPMLNCLVSLGGEEIQDKPLRKAVSEIAQDVEAGNSFSESLAKHPKIFNVFFIATVRAGEAVGELDTVLLRLADILEKDYQTRSKIKAATRYPIFILIVMTVAFLIATLFIIPRFKNLFTQFGGELPLPTRILMGASDFVMNYWYVVILMVVGGTVGLMSHYKTYQGRRFWDGIFLRLGFVGTFIRHSIFSRFTRMFGMMLKSGVDILQALGLVSDIVGNSIVSDAILRIREKVGGGETLSKELRREGMFPGLLIQIVAAGEASGKMDELLVQIAEYYDGEIDLMTKNMESLIEPVFILLLGGFVGVMALGIFLPMWNLYGLIQQST